MCQRGGPSIAAFLQQAEENLALLGARGDCRTTSWPASRLRSTDPSLARGQSSSTQDHEPSLAPSSHTSSSSQCRAALGEGGDAWQAVADDVVANSARKAGGMPGVASAAASAAAVPQAVRAVGAARHAHDDEPRPNWSPRIMESWARRLDGARASVDTALKKAEDRQLEAKEQMDVQAKTMLGLDRKVRGFDARIRAVEAAVAAAADMAAEAASTASPGARGRSRRSVATDEEARERSVESRARVPSTSPGPTPRQQQNHQLQQLAQQRELAELSRRVSNLGDAARKEREVVRQNARRVVDTHAVELKRSLEQRIDTLDGELREREQRLQERLQQELRRHAENLGKDIAGELLRGPVTELVERRSREHEQVLRNVEREMEKRLRDAELAQRVDAERLEHLVQSRVLSTIATEGVSMAAGDQLGGIDTNDDTRNGHVRSLGSTASPNGLLRRTMESVAELEAWAQREERTYWDTVQALEVRVGSLECSLSDVQEDTETEKAFVRKRLVVLEKDTQQLRNTRSAVVQDPAAQKKYYGGGNSPRAVSKPLHSPSSSGHFAAFSSSLAGKDTLETGEPEGLLITPRLASHSHAQKKPSVAQDRRSYNAASAVKAVTGRASYTSDWTSRAAEGTQLPLELESQTLDDFESAYESQFPLAAPFEEPQQPPVLVAEMEDGAESAGVASGKGSANGSAHGSATKAPPEDDCDEMQAAQEWLVQDAAAKGTANAAASGGGGDSSGGGSRRSSGRWQSSKEALPLPLRGATPEQAASETGEAQVNAVGDLVDDVLKMQGLRESHDLPLDEPPTHENVESSSSWACPQCTLQNENSVLECDACGFAKPQVSSTSPKQKVSKSHAPEKPVELWDEILGNLGLQDEIASVTSSVKPSSNRHKGGAGSYGAAAPADSRHRRSSAGSEAGDSITSFRSDDDLPI